MVEEMLATRGICVTYETVRQWGRSSARHSPIRSASARLLAATNGIWMRSSLDRRRATLAVARRRSERLRSRCPGPASKRQSRCATAHEEAPEIRGHIAARHDHRQAPFIRRSAGEDGPSRQHRQHKRLNIGAENSHQPTRRRERIMKRFKSGRQAQRFLSVHDQVANLFHPLSEIRPADFRRTSRASLCGLARDLQDWRYGLTHLSEKSPSWAGVRAS